MKLFVRAVLVCLLLFFVAVVASPYYRLYQLQEAYERQAYDYIVEQIDFEMLRPNLKRQLHVKIEQVAAKSKLGQGLAALGVDLQTLSGFMFRFVDGVVDKTVTPDNINRLAQGQIDKDGESLLAIMAIINDYVDMDKLGIDYLSTGSINQAMENQQIAAAKKMAADAQAPTKPNLSYCGISCFSVQSQIYNKPITVMLYRQNLIDWKIGNVVFGAAPE